MTLGGGGGRVCSNNPDHKVGMLAQRILKMPSSMSLGVLELLSYRIVLLHVYEKLYNIRFLGNHGRLWYKS